MRASSLLSTLAAFAVLASPVLAQKKTPSSSSSSAASSSSSSAPSSSSSPASSSSSSSVGSSSTPSPSQTADDSGPTGLPTLTRPNGAVPTYPAPSVPPTKNAPFMKHSSAPDGTVFIAVGAILGAFGLGVLLWRVIVSFLLHRSVRRAALAQHEANNKTGFPAPPAPFYKYSDHASPAAPSSGRGVRRTNRNTMTPSAAPSQSNLFFSPTAAGSNAPGARGSAFLPSGFYAAGTSSPGGQQGPSISLTNLRPESTTYPNGSRNSLMGPSPPDSPHFSPRRDMSSSSVNLNTRQPGQRAPSAYLEDLLADEPGSLPPPQMPRDRASGSGSPRGSPRNRY